MSEDKTAERRRGDTSFKVIMFLLGIVQAMVLGWVWKVDGQASRVPVLSSQMDDIRLTVGEIKSDIKTLLGRK